MQEQFIKLTYKGEQFYVNAAAIVKISRVEDRTLIRTVDGTASGPGILADQTPDEIVAIIKGI